MKDLKFRNLTKDEIEVRVGSGGTLLLYKTARVDANILDETVGAFNWQKKFYQVKNTMICEISINANYDDPNKEPLFISKCDGGDDDYQMEKVKAECSDSMKRAGFQWGIGRSLYTAPKIKIPSNLMSRVNDKNNPIYFDVSEVGYDNKGKINELVITADWGKTMVFEFRNGRKQTNNTTSTTNLPKKEDSPTMKNEDSDDENMPIREEEKAWIQDYIGQLSGDRYNDFFNWLEKDFGTRRIADLTASQGIIIVSRLKRAKK